MSGRRLGRRLGGRRVVAAVAGLAAVGVVLGLVASTGSTSPARTAGGGVWANRKAPAPRNAPPSRRAATTPAAAVEAVDAVPLRVLARARRRDPAAALVRRLAGPPLREGGRPVVLAVTAPSCPTCAAEGWAVVVALAKFGRFVPGSAAAAPSSPASIADPLTAGLRFTSRWVDLVVRTRAGPGAPLRLGARQEAALRRADPRRLVPFVDVGGLAVPVGAPGRRDLLDGRSLAAVAAAVLAGRAPVALPIDAGAGALVEQICRATGGRPGGVCAGVNAPAAKAGSG